MELDRRKFIGTAVATGAASLASSVIGFEAGKAGVELKQRAPANNPGEFIKNKFGVEVPTAKIENLLSQLLKTEHPVVLSLEEFGINGEISFVRLENKVLVIATESQKFALPNNIGSAPESNDSETNNNHII